MTIVGEIRSPFMRVPAYGEIVEAKILVRRFAWPWNARMILRIFLKRVSWAGASPGCHTEPQGPSLAGGPFIGEEWE